MLIACFNNITMKAELFFMIERFPELKELILSQYDSDEEFQVLCLDYFLCLRSIDNWEADMKKFKERHREYEELRRMLEDKMLQFISKDNNKQSD
jgi:hypothetical protein